MLIIRGGLNQLTPNQVLGDVMTQKTYRVEREGVDKDGKKEDEEKKKKSVAFKASSSSKNKGKSKKEESSEDKMLVTLMMSPWLSLCANLASS